MKKKIAIIITACILISSLVLPCYANTDVEDPSKQQLYTFLDKTVNALVGGIAAMIKTPYSWKDKKDFKSENFYPGYSKDEFIDEPADNAAWSLGYANASLLTGKEVGGGDYYVGGSLSVTKKLATKQHDDQKVRTVAISDGRGVTIFSVLDAYGLANSDVRAIRGEFAKWAEKEGIKLTAVNISVLHQHSCVDTFGMNGDIVSALFLSSIKSLLGIKLPSGQNPEYMDHLYDVTIGSMKDAVKSMEPGTLYYGKVDVKEYIYDKRDPQVFENNMNRFRFEPDNAESKETWIANCGIHCVGHGAAGTELTGDYPYYMEEYINKNDNANLLYIEGAELAITLETDNIKPDATTVEKVGEDCATLAEYGYTIAKKLESITPDDETVVEPILNISFKEVWVEIENNILVLAAKGGLLVNNVAKDGIGKYAILTEVGYAEFGKGIAVPIIPGELAPEIAFGGANDGFIAWNDTKWEIPAFNELCKDKQLIVFGLTNDQIGYLINENNWHSYFAENEEIVSCGKSAATTIANTYVDLYKEYN